MRRLVFVAVVVSLAVAAFAADPDEQVCRQYQGKQVCQPAQAHTLLVRTKNPANDAAVMARVAELLDSPGFDYLAWTVPGMYQIHSRTLSAQQMFDKLNGDPDFLWVEPNARAPKQLHNTPNDPLWAPLQWWAGNGTGYSGGDGQGVGCTSGGVGPNLPSAWDITTGSKQVAVVIDDTGLDYTDPDLAGNVWSANIPFTIMVNGTPLTCPAGTHGFDVSNASAPSCDPQEGIGSGTPPGHGTGVAGMVGAVGNNGLAVTGTAWNVTLIGMAATSSVSGYYSNHIAAADMTAQLQTLFPSLNIRAYNASWGYGPGVVPPQSMHDMWVALASSNVLITVAAGNNSYTDLTIPANYSYPPNWTDIANMITVGGVQCHGQLYGDVGVGVVAFQAPGLETFTTVWPSCSNTGDACAPTGLGAPSWTGFFGGTSASAPVTAGVIALVASRCPNLGWAAIKSLLLSNVTVVPALSGYYTTSGRLNAAAALNACASAYPVQAQHAIGVGN